MSGDNTDLGGTEADAVEHLKNVRVEEWKKQE